jgi:hypothetical protein
MNGLSAKVEKTHPNPRAFVAPADVTVPQAVGTYSYFVGYDFEESFFRRLAY